MIIDCHAHVSAPTALWAYKASILSHRGAHGRGKVEVTDDEIKAAYFKKEMGPVGHIPMMEKNGIDKQLISPRPFQMMHSFEPQRIVHWFTEETNNIIARSVQLFPDKFFGVCGLPQSAGAAIETVLPELERCITKLGFKGCLLNPDPYENGGQEAPGLGERYWYPLYEKLCELDVPAHIHATGSKSERTPYTLHFINEESIAVYNLAKSNVFKDFPKLKIVVSHGGGAIPYQIGRFMRTPDFLEGMRNLYYDTVLYTEAGLRLLIETVGVDRCIYGAECPGVGSGLNPKTGSTWDDIVPIIKKFDWLSEADKKTILSDNATKVFKL
ncbi:amidohydrolase family protein [Methylocella sp. CPCC 101449]|jgi:predicted TIM-barrel fold metal-dependent hydrolase|uniref:amidohydrolase family protein n=1 Tax=Methylocella sp. CPCC 101449 TaxID=2987531 RepID=UPI002890DA3F|nr:amidohydrolase family protein [Methylocella sp. CPCC 101449]MDT2022855.1 amidohydrolase [Methylocella sp. CPCC 101449]HEV2570501.1 amidohydrolase family protein [Beijerinckiaceae bacterium]